MILTKRESRVLLAGECVTGLVGFALLWAALGGMAALGVFFVLWSKNLHDRQTNSTVHPFHSGSSSP